MRKVYMDYASTTPVDSEVIEAMSPYLDKKFGNTESLHGFGREAKEELEKSRATIASLIGAKKEYIVFTSSATESNNFALKGIAWANKDNGKHIIISSIEHACVMESALWLEKQGFDVTRLNVDKYGLVDPEVVENEIRDDTILVSVMHANNEIGTLEPVTEIGKVCKERNVYFHTDAAQSYGKLPIDVNKMDIDVLTASSHKMYGPKGVGCLYVGEGVEIAPLLHGGGHEFGLRSSTPNVAGVVGFAKAAELCKCEMNKESKRLSGLRDRLIKNLMDINNSYLNGHPRQRLPNNINIRFDFVEGESIVMGLDEEGIASSTGSACSSKKLKPSHVLMATGLTPQEAHGSLRLSLGRWTNKKNVNYAIEKISEVVERLREISPFKEGV